MNALSSFQKTIPGRVAILLLIAVAIGGIWIVKQRQKALKEQAEALHVTSEKSLAEALTSGLPVVIDFGADSCAPCREMAPVLEELNRTLQGKAVIKFVDVWKYPDLAKDYPLRVIPTQFFFDRDGKPFTPSDARFGMILYGDGDTKGHTFTAHEGGMTREQLLAVLAEMGVRLD